MSFVADGDSGVIGGLGSGGFRSRLRRWAAPHEQGEASGGAGWAGECLVATNGTGRQRRPNRPEVGEMASSGQSTARGALGGRPEVA